MPNLRAPARIAAAIIAATAWTGLAVQWVVIVQSGTPILPALWIMLDYFTVLTNLLVAIVFTALAADHAANHAIDRATLRSPGTVAGTMLAILLVGIIYALLLHGTMELSGGSVVANILNHMVTPALVPLFWIAFTPKGHLNRRHPFLWAIYPLTYLAYCMVRGAATGSYAYPFLDALALGWQRTALNVLIIAIAFMLAGFAVVWVDNRLAPRSAP